MYSRKLPLFAYVLTLAGILFLTAFRSADAIKEGQPSQTNAPLLGASHEPVLLPDPTGAMRLDAVDVVDNLRRTPTTLDWRKAEGPTHKSLDFFKLMREQTKVPDSILHDLRLIGGWGRCNQSLGIDHAGTQGLLMPNGVTHAACNLVTLMDTFQFKVYDYAMFPFLASTNSSEGHNAAFETMKGRVATGVNSYYLLLGTQINPADKSVIFRVGVNLPKEGVFNNVDATLEELIVADVTEAMNLEFDGANSVTSIYAAEVAGMEKMKEIIEQLISGAYNSNVSESFLQKLKFYPLLGEASNITRTGVGIEDGIVRDFAGLLLNGASVTPELAFSFTQKIPFTTKIFVTDNECRDSFAVVQNLIEASNAKFVVWLHYFKPNSASAKQVVYAKSVNKLNADEIDTALMQLRNDYKGSSPAKVNNQFGESRSGCHSFSFSPSWRIKGSGNPNLFDCLETDFPFLTPFPYYAGFSAGFIDGALDEVCFFAEIAQGLIDFLRYSTPNGQVFEPISMPGSSIFQISWATDVAYRMFKKDICEKGFNVTTWNFDWKGAKAENMQDAIFFWQKVNATLANFNNLDKISKFLMELKNTLVTWSNNIIGNNGPKLEGYEQGKLVFQLIYTVLTVGTGALTSLAKTAIKEISEGVSLNLIGSKLLRASVEKMDDIWQKAKCTILSVGCFAAGTLVATAQGNTPIELLYPSTFITSKYEHSDGGQNLSRYALAYNINSEENLNAKSPLDYDNLEITPEGWKWVFFAITGEDGSTTNAWLLRPIEWLQKNGVDEIDKTMWINLPGLEIEGVAKVVGFIQNEVDTRIKKEINSRQESYIYRPIIGWFQRNTPEIWEYSFSNGDSIQATPNHPFYSDDKKTFVPIGQISLHEKIKVESGKDVFLTCRERLPNENPVVYNLEVWKDHNFLVGKGHILVHNDCFKTFKDYLANKGFGSMQKCSPRTTLGAKAIPCENCINGAIQLADDRIVPIDKLAFPKFENFTLKSGNSSPASYEIDMKGNYFSDINLANAQFQNSDLYSELSGLGNGIEIIGTGVKITPPGGGNSISYTWHHHQDIKHMMLVETIVHEAVHHTGGRALASTFRDDLGFFDLITKPEF